ncbi:SDR family oxidoreductase [Halapricum hydrolyticum]|uniref:SDR family oxidoreductase n=1 Tax=Halapricum hydrolyticum TaxID=2979991 RepID=A0AAE3ICB8_9EURY|nr:SDR family oxidoreductase [Halapricum hydrolyticum]MCU4717048.1 SDR family oxidoreductase [Halapricum hydrolyticum]MCU4725974.1 SDR family oxidoreductase [Halapricum hydrolyticum]
METVLVTGATGTVGSRVVNGLADCDVAVRAATRAPDDGQFRDGVGVAFDFEKPETWGAAFEGVDAMFLVRPPAITRVGDSILPAIDAAVRVGVERIVLLSVLGAEKNPLLPHRKIEKHLRATDVAWTFLRASFFMENLLKVHQREIAGAGEIVVPAGDGETSFVAAEDVATVATAALTEPGHARHAYDVTGPEALTYHDAARVLSDALGRPVTYEAPSLVRFARHSRRLGRDWPFLLVMAGLYTTARLGLAGRMSDDVERVLRRPPTTFQEWAERNAAAFDLGMSESADDSLNGDG